MAALNHQTVRIGRGRHESPRDGACVMELASMLAGEAFSDRPRCVDPVLAAFLRSFNDRLGHAQRQRLLPYAARAVGTRSSRALTRRRLELCVAYATGAPRRRGLLRLAVALQVGVRWALRLRVSAPDYAARSAIARGDVEGGFSLIDAMLAVGGPVGEATPVIAAARPAEGPQLAEPAREPVPAGR